MYKNNYSEFQTATGNKTSTRQEARQQNMRSIKTVETKSKDN
jgi:hypothetical protein